MNIIDRLNLELKKDISKHLLYLYKNFNNEVDIFFPNELLDFLFNKYYWDIDNVIDDLLKNNKLNFNNLYNIIFNKLNDNYKLQNDKIYLRIFSTAINKIHNNYKLIIEIRFKLKKYINKNNEYIYLTWFKIRRID